MALNKGQFGIQYDPYDRRPAWPWFVAFCIVIAALVLIFVVVRKKGRQIADKQAVATAVENVETAAARGRDAPLATAPPPLPATSSVMPESLRVQFAAAERAAQEANYQEARKLWLAVFQDPLLPNDARAKVEQQLATVTLPLLSTAAPMPGKINYTIKSGDAIAKIARNHGMTQEMVMKINGITDPARINVGHKLVVLDKPAFSVRVEREAGSVALFWDKGFVKRWPAFPGVGDATPTGEFVVGTREAPGRLVLSPLAINKAVGKLNLTGTHDRNPQRGAGKNIVMKNTDIEELVSIIPALTPVTIE